MRSEPMKAKFGKLSIVCFIVPWLSLPLLKLLDVFTGYRGCPAGSHMMLLGPLVLLGVVSGAILGIIGVVKKESPRKYSVIGLLLNAGLILLFTIKAITIR